jgi:hypothetical protein
MARTRPPSFTLTVMPSGGNRSMAANDDNVMNPGTSPAERKQAS